ncbi:MAG: hypothetical protein IID05_13600, partial [Gemmatimonadetes bacterium]|nr:hypothetical protein [Gemmatimonadota bacterium]
MKTSHVVVVAVLALALSSAVAVAGGVQDVFVDDNYTGLGDETMVGFPFGTQPEDKEIGDDAFASMQDGIDRANDDGTVNVAAGTYRENLEIDKNLTIVGADRVTTILDGDVNNNGTVNSRGTVHVTGAAGTVNISNVTIQNGFTDFDGAGIEIDGSTVVLDNVTVSGNHSTDGDGGGVSVASGGVLTMTGGSIEGNSTIGAELGDGGGGAGLVNFN